MKKKFIKFNYIFLLCLFSFNKKVFAAVDTMDCEDLGNLRRDLENFFNFIKILVPILVIGLSSYDFIKAITAKDDKDIKKSFTKLMKRLVCAVLLFFLPIILNFFLGLIIDNASVCIGIS